MGKILESAGVHVIIDAFVNDASVFTQENLTGFFRDLVKAIDMEILVGPNFIEVPVDPEVLRKSQESGVFADEGGLTGTCIVSKSHVSLHAWPLQEFFSFDVFSCGDFDPEVVLKMTYERLGVRASNAHVINRKKPVCQQPAVYCITNTKNGKRYIGKSVNASGRWGHHVWLAGHPEHKNFGHLHAAIAKYGVDAFTFEILEVCITEDAAFEAEVWWVEKYDTQNSLKGYNLTAGGRGGSKPSPETRQKMSKPGAKNGMFGRTHTPEAKAKMGQANKGRKHPPRTHTHKDAISRARRGEASNMAHLTEAKVREMRSRAEQGVSQSVLASDYGVSVPTVSRIVRRLVWKHIP